MDRYSYFLGDSDTLLITHVWGTGCNFKCSFCLNEGVENLKKNKDINFKISEIFADYSQISTKKILFIEHGGELLYCDYLRELFEFKTKNIKDYRSLFFTNGSHFKKYREFILEFKDYTEPFLSFHPVELVNNPHHLNEFKKCIEFNIQEFGYCNISMVYFKELPFELFKNTMSHLEPYKEHLYIKVFFDYHMLYENNIKNIIASCKYMAYLDKEGYRYKKLLNDGDHGTFIGKSLFLMDTKYREGIISKYMAAIEVVGDIIQYYDYLREEHIFKFDDIASLRKCIFEKSDIIEHNLINNDNISIAYQHVEIL